MFTMSRCVEAGGARSIARERERGQFCLRVEGSGRGGTAVTQQALPIHCPQINKCSFTMHILKLD